MIRRALLVWVVGFAVIQLVPYGWKHENPPDVAAAVFPDEETGQLARVACGDCHSNRTNWPPWSFVAPMSWLIRRDVDQGRDRFNFSDWDQSAGDADKAAQAIAEGSMPPRRYTLMHPDAKLSPAEKQRLIDALNQMED